MGLSRSSGWLDLVVLQVSSNLNASVIGFYLSSSAPRHSKGSSVASKHCCSSVIRVLTFTLLCHSQLEAMRDFFYFIFLLHQQTCSGPNQPETALLCAGLTGRELLASPRKPSRAANYFSLQSDLVPDSSGASGGLKWSEVAQNHTSHTYLLGCGTGLEGKTAPTTPTSNIPVPCL